MADQLMNPRGVFRYEEKPIAPRAGDLHKKVIGLVDNSKQNADLFLNLVLEDLRQRFDIAEVLRVRKSSGPVPAPFTPEVFERIDFAVNAFGD